MNERAAAAPEAPAATATTDRRPAAVVTPPTLCIEGLRKNYGDDIWALRGVDLVVQPGEFVAISGPSGCGKSTLLHLIAALDSPTDGSIAVNGTSLADLHDLGAYRRNYVGLVFQLHNLLTHLSVAANVEIAMLGTTEHRHARRQRALELLAEVDLAGRENRLPTQLSGGERQRVAIARALANRPSLLLADEPTGNLDPASTQRILDLLRQQRAHGVTMLLVTHDRDVATAADRVVSMQDGVIVG